MTTSTPWLRIHPAEAAWSAKPGTVEVGWDSGTDERWEVWTQPDDSEPQLFAAGPRGSRSATWISAGQSFHFTLSPPGRPSAIAARATTRMALRAASERTPPRVSLSPNPFPRDEERPVVRLDWDTGDGSLGRVMLVNRDGHGERETIAGHGAVGTRLIDWINSNERYEFRLYRLSDGGRRVAARVIGNQPRQTRELILDLGAFALIVALWPVAAAARTYRRLIGRKSSAFRRS